MIHTEGRGKYEKRHLGCTCEAGHDPEHKEAELLGI
jgi:hypothetical protein